MPVVFSQTNSVETGGVLLESTLSSWHQPGAKGVLLGCFSPWEPMAVSEMRMEAEEKLVWGQLERSKPQTP